MLSSLYMESTIPTTQDILDALQLFSGQMDKLFGHIELRLDGIEKRLDNVERRLDSVEKRLDSVEKRLDSVERRLDSVERRLDQLERRIAKIEATMVTKDYLDAKFVDFKADFKNELAESIRQGEKRIATW